MAIAPTVNRDAEPDEGGPLERLEALERGLRALALFGTGESRSLSMIEIAERLAIPRAAARRVLHTLVETGYVRSDGGRRYSLTARVLTLGHAYLASLGFREVAEPILRQLADTAGETCSLGVLDARDVVYVLRIEHRRLVRMDLRVGSRLPAHLSSMGRVLLAALPDAALDAYLTSAELRAFTPRTIVDRGELRAEILRVRAHGWCRIVDEMEEGIRGLAVPVRDGQGVVVAALNLSLGIRRRSPSEVRERLLPLLLDCATELERVIRAGLRPG